MIKWIKRHGRAVLLTVCIMSSPIVVGVVQPITFGAPPAYACPIQYPDCGG